METKCKIFNITKSIRNIFYKWMNFFSLFSTNSILISFSFVLFTKHQIRFTQYLFAMDCKIKNVFVFFFSSLRTDANKTLECCIYICRWNMFVCFHYFHMEKFSTKNTILLPIASSIVFVFFFLMFSAFGTIAYIQTYVSRFDSKEILQSLFHFFYQP